MTRKGKKNKVANEWIPSNEQIRQIYQHGDTIGRALLLVLYQGGLFETDVSNLNLEQLPNLRKHKGHYLITLRKKKDFIRKTCISEEAIREINEMLRERGNPPSGPLFLNQKGKRLGTRSINRIIENMVAKAYNDKKLEEFKTKSLRRAYVNALLRANLTKETKDYIVVGKRQSSVEAHSINKLKILKAYKKAFRYLTVGHANQDRKDLERPSITINTLVERLDEKDREITTLKQAIKNLRKTSSERIEENWRQLAETRKQLDSIREAFQAFLKRVKEK